jgi:divalent metal cation (Fe/Co/Zn/Cd) transporter
LGLILIKITHINEIDLFLSVILSFYLIYNGFGLIKKSVAGLMDQTDEELYTTFANKLNEVRKDNWIDVHNFRIIQYGSSYHIDCHLTLPYYLTLEESHEEVGRFEKEICEITKQETEIFTHTDPCLPACCSYCKITECKRRNQPFKDIHLWTNKNLQRNE